MRGAVSVAHHTPCTGRAWTANELRLKSFEDLHGLWFVLLKEKNNILTERLHLKQGGMAQPDGGRLKKVRDERWHSGNVPCIHAATLPGEEEYGSP